MSKTETEQAFEATYDGPTKSLKDIPADLVAFESLGLGKLPRPVSSALEAYVWGYTEVQPVTRARRAHTEKAREAAVKDQRVADAQAVSDVLAKGPDSFAKLATALDKVDLVAQANQAHAYAVRTDNAADGAIRGQLGYINRLVGSEYRAEMLATLDKAHNTYVLVRTSPDTTLGDLAAMEGKAEAAREIIGRLLLYVEHQNRARGFTTEDAKAVRDALKTWEELPTFDRIQERQAQEAANSPEAKAREDAERTKDAEREETQRYGADAAKARQERWGFVKGNAEAERGINRPENEDEDEDELVET